MCHSVPLENTMLRAVRLLQGIPWSLHVKFDKLWLNDDTDIDASSCFTPALSLNSSLTTLCASQSEFSISQAREVPQSLRVHPAFIETTVHFKETSGLQPLVIPFPEALTTSSGLCGHLHSPPPIFTQTLPQIRTFWQLHLAFQTNCSQKLLFGFVVLKC